MVIRLITFAWLFLVALPLATAATFTASFDRTITHIGGSVLLTLQLDTSADGEPDLTPLNTDFEIINQNKSSNINIINGSMQRNTVVQVTLMPRREGILSIKPIQWDAYLSQPLRLNVQSADQSSGPDSDSNRDLFLDVAVTTQRPYVQAQVIYTARLFRAVNLTQAQLSEPTADHLVAQRLGEDSNYETTRHGRRYVVTERRYALFPQQSGKLKIPALRLDASVSSNRFSFAQGQPTRINSKAIELDVQPIPAHWQASAWLAAESVNLSESWPTQSAAFRVGEAITRTLQITAQGVTAAQLPPLLEKTATLPGLKRYPDQPVLKDETHKEGITATRQEKIAIIPMQAGDFRLPAIQLSWWNTKTGQAETANIAARTIHVLAAEVSQNSGKAPPSTALHNGDRSETATTSTTAPGITAENHNVDNNRLWMLLALFFAVAWLLTLLLWWQQHRKHHTAQVLAPENEPQPGIGKLKKEIERACKANDASHCIRLLLQWGQSRFPDAAITHIQALATLPTLTATPEWAQQLTQLEHACFSGSAPKWNGDVFWQHFSTLKIEADNGKPAGRAPLQPLYPI